MNHLAMTMTRTIPVMMVAVVVEAAVVVVIRRHPVILVRRFRGSRRVSAQEAWSQRSAAATTSKAAHFVDVEESQQLQPSCKGSGEDRHPGHAHSRYVENVESDRQSSC
jgi:hypothetical protein